MSNDWKAPGETRKKIVIDMGLAKLAMWVVGAWLFSHLAEAGASYLRQRTTSSVECVKVGGLWSRGECWRATRAP